MGILIGSTEKNYNLCYSPKSACTYIRAFFLTLHHKEVPNLKLEYNSIHKITRKIFPINRNPTATIFFVRNPYERAVSMYVDKYCAMYKDDNWKMLGENLTFNEFLDQIKDNQKELFSCENTHFNKQIANVKQTLKDSSTVVIKCEEGVQSIERFYCTLGYKNEQLENAFKFAKNVGINYSYYGKEESSDAPDTNFFGHNTVKYTKQSFLNNTTRQKIYEIYEDDFIALGYKKG